MTDAVVDDPIDGVAPEDDELLTPAEVASRFRVSARTVTRWARAGKLTALRTPGGHRRYFASEVRRCLTDIDDPQS